MTVRARVLPGRYVDSVILMRLAQRLAASDGIADAAALMATEANKRLLEEGGFGAVEAAAGANDLVVVVKAESAVAADTALGEVEELLAPADGRAGALPTARTLDDAVALRLDLNLAVVSVPGEHAAREARRALELGLHVFLFSSNVPVEEEVALKRLAGERGLLCMGPDCGTAIVDGVGVGFANVVRRGPVGVVAASGTGIQAVTSLLDGFGVGITHAIGCGSRDVSEAVGATTMLAGLDALLADVSTRAIVLVSKPPAPTIAALLRDRAAAAAKPVVCCFLGDAQGPATLEDAARAAAQAVGMPPPPSRLELDNEALAALATRLGPARRYVRGLYAGGTLGYEAQLVLRERGLDVASNAPLPGSRVLDDPSRSEGHTVVDLGSEEFTRGRPHPMIDARARRARLKAEAADPETAVVLLDFVLGYGAAADPAGDLAAAIAAAGNVVVLASVCGTAADPQGLVAQEETLRRAGAVVLETNAAAARTAASLAARVAPAGSVAEGVV